MGAASTVRRSRRGVGTWLLLSHPLASVAHSCLPHQHPESTVGGCHGEANTGAMCRGPQSLQQKVVPERYFVRCVLSRRAWGLLTAIVCPDCCNATQ